jgi:hypothetical protein
MHNSRSIRSFSSLLLLFILLAAIIQPVLAQTYRFEVVRYLADVYVNEDGTVSIAYLYEFRNSPNADPIDAVDIGMPTRDYDLSSVTAQVNGQTVTNISKSPYVDPGIAIDLGQYDIQPGQTGEVTVQIGTVRGMLFKASAQEAEPYASFQFAPNFFGSEFVTGTTEATVTLHLPPDLLSEEPRYFEAQNWPGSEAPDELGFDEQNRVFYRWFSPRANASSQYIFGASFPARVVPAGVLMTEVPFRLNWESLCPLLFCLGFAGFMGLVIYGGITSERKRRLAYLPPKLSIEGNGIKRGLTAVEAAIVMQQPMDRILTMILFSVLKKGAASVIDRSPMKLEITHPAPKDLQTYELGFLQAMEAPKLGEQRNRLQEVMTGLVKSVSEKMRGFSRKETEAYYKSIMEKAWEQVSAADTPEMKMKNFDEAMDWTMLDQRFDERTRDTFGPRPVIMPMWWGRFDPNVGRSQPSMPSSSLPSGNNPPQGMNLPTIPGGEFAASMVTGMQTFSSDVVGNLTSFTGGVTDKTNPVPKTTSSGGGRRGGGGGGGRSCACACACAGCACACAGGGR